MEKIELFLFVLSIVYNLKHVFQFIMRLRETEPEPINLTNIEIVIFYFTISYIITFLL